MARVLCLDDCVLPGVRVDVFVEVPDRVGITAFRTRGGPAGSNKISKFFQLWELTSVSDSIRESIFIRPYLGGRLYGARDTLLKKKLIMLLV